MYYLQGVSIFLWRANHIALQISNTEYTYERGHYLLNYEREGKPVVVNEFRGFTHSSDFEESCSSSYTPATIKDVINAFFDGERMNHYFQLQALGALSVFSITIFTGGVIAIIVAPYIPIFLAAIIGISAASSLVSLSLFAKEMQPTRPSSQLVPSCLGLN